MSKSRVYRAVRWRFWAGNMACAVMVVGIWASSDSEVQSAALGITVVVALWVLLGFVEHRRMQSWLEIGEEGLVYHEANGSVLRAKFEEIRAVIIDNSESGGTYIKTLQGHVPIEHLAKRAELIKWLEERGVKSRNA